MEQVMTQEERDQVLERAGIPLEDREACEVTEDGQIFTPIRDDTGTLLKSGAQVYEEWLAGKDAPETGPEDPEARLSDMELMLLDVDCRLLLLENGMADIGS